MSSSQRIELSGRMSAANTQRLFDILESEGAGLRFVGGCVRDAVLGRNESSDIDLATDALPHRVSLILRRSGIGVAEFGMDHGTVTAIISKRTYEITTLRRDVATDGRRAQVEFTTDWASDAQRRDFTMNGLFADRRGTVFDHVGGIGDIAEGRVRFIGKASDRIVEDHLRILRFFRFHASHGRGKPDKDALQACSASAHLVNTLPGERLWNELSRLLAAPAAIHALAHMEDAGVLAHLLPTPRNIEKAERLTSLERTLKTSPDPIRHLASLMPEEQGAVGRAARRLRLSKANALRLEALALGDKRLTAELSQPEVSALIYRLGPERFRDLALLGGASQDKGSGERRAWLDLAKRAEAWVDPVFPVEGRDVTGLGVSQGPEVGVLLSAVEAWWVEQSFRPGRKACLERLAGLVSSARDGETGN